MKKLYPLLAFLLFVSISNAQSYDSAAIAQRFKKVDHILNILKDFRFKAFVQPEWQRADTASANSVQYGNFPTAANNRFVIRWGRFILGWQHEIVNKHGDSIKVGEFYFNENITEKGFTGPYDFYGRIIDPWTGWFGLRGGIFLRQFGFETPENADVMQCPEGNRINQNIFPNVSELGEEIIIESPRTFKPLYLKINAGMVNGNGILVGAENGAYESRKDFLGRIWIGKSWKLGESSKISINASGSYYNGGVMQTTDSVYQLTPDSAGLYFKNVTVGTSKGGGAWQKQVIMYKREYVGAHAQINFDYKIKGSFSATTMIRGEFITGTQPGQWGTNQVPTGTLNGTPTYTGAPNTNLGAGLYLRKFMGGAFYFTQSFHYMAGKQQMHTDITFKYDGYDPNTQVKGSEIIASRGFSKAGTDVAWNTFSGGISFSPVPYFKLMLWYDHVVNESTGLTGTRFATDYAKDNVFTIRTQFSIDSWWWDKKSMNSNLIVKTY